MICINLVAAGAVGAAALAGVPGGTGNYCHLTWDKQCCPVPGCDVSIAPGILTICNEKPEMAEFTWELIDVSGMGLQFMPQSGVASPGNTPTGEAEICIDIPFTVICPPNFPLGSVADYQAIVTKVSTGETFSCFGNVVNNSDWKIDPVGDPVIEVGIPADATAQPEPARARLSVSNIGSSGKDGVSIYAVPMGPFDAAPAVLNVPPIPPGSSWQVDSFFDITYRIAPPVSSRGVLPPQVVMGDIIFMIDTTIPPDGVPDTVVGSQTVRGVPTAAPCLGDLNGDGVVDTADLGLLLGSFGFLCP